MTYGLTKQARTLSDQQQRAALAAIAGKPTETRDRVVLLLSWKAGLRAKEIASVTWAMACDAEGAVADVLAVTNAASKGKHGGRAIPLHKDLKAALVALKPAGVAMDQRIVRDARGFPMAPNGLAQWFHRFYAALGFDGCSSHSGRRTFVTRLARNIVSAGGSLRDVQELAGHASLAMTARYIDVNEGAQARAVRML